MRFEEVGSFSGHVGSVLSGIGSLSGRVGAFWAKEAI